VKAKGYIHHSTKSSRDIGNILRAEVEKLYVKGIDILENRLTPKQFNALVNSNREVRELVNCVKYVSGGAQIKSTDDLVEQWAKINNFEATGEILGNVNSFGYRRSQEQTIPWLIRETNTVALADKWLKDTLRFAITREPMREVSKWISIFNKRGMHTEADYLKTYVRKAAGIESTWWTHVNMDEAIDARVKSPLAREALKSIPALTSVAMNAMYATLLAGPKSFFQNLEQPITKMAVGIGDTIGMDITLRAYTRTAAAYASIPEAMFRKGTSAGELDTVIKTAIDKGQLPAKQFGEAVTKSKASSYQLAVNGAARVFTTLFDKADRITRITALFAGKELSERAVKGDAKVLSEFVEGNLKRFPAVQREVRELIKKGDTEKLTDMISDHLLQTEMFVYNTTSKSEFMHKIGPYVAMFSKWPTEILGDVVGGIRAGDSERTVIRALTPLLQMAAVGTFLKDKYKELNRDEKAAFEIYPGKPEWDRYARRAPISSVPAVLELFTGGALSGPMISPVVNGFKALLGNEKAQRDFYNKDLYNLTGNQLREHIYENWPRVLLGAYNAVTEDERDIDIDFIDVKKDWEKWGRQNLKFKGVSRVKRKAARGVKDIFEWLSESTEGD